MAQRISYSLRKRVNLQAYPRANDGTPLKPISLGMGFSPCKCTPETPSLSCRNRSTYVIDIIDGKFVSLQECPNRFDDAELWADIYFVLYTLKDWAGAAVFMGVAPMHMSYTHYQFYDLCFAARDRYQQQKADKE